MTEITRDSVSDHIDRRAFVTSALAVGATTLTACQGSVIPVFKRIVRPGEMGLPEEHRRITLEHPHYPTELELCGKPVTPKQIKETVAGLYLYDNFAGRLALTFDDGPRPKTTPKVLKTLDEFNVKGLFFVCGRLCRRFPGVLREVVRRGHVLGNHTYSHPNLAALSNREIRQQWDKTQAAVDKALGYHYPLKYYRPPYGSPWFSNPGTRKRAVARQCRHIDKRSGLLVMWQVYVADARTESTVTDSYRRFKRSVNRNDGGAIVLHDSNDITVGALPKILRYAVKRNMKFVSVEELLHQKYSCALDKLVNLPTVSRTERS